MHYIQFDKRQLVNLEYSLSKEYLRANSKGTYDSSTIINCNTRKYHGMLVCLQPQLDNDRHVLLSCLDETIIQGDQVFHLGIHKYPGNYNPKGHKYMDDFDTEPIPKQTYRVGSVILTKEILLAMEEERIYHRYTVIDSLEPFKIRFHPFLAFRNVHQLCKANVQVDRKFEIIDNGIRVRLYQGYNYLNMQFSKKTEYIHAPDWYYNIEYIEEKERGYDFKEDLFVPGFFETLLKKGDSLIFTAGLTETKPKGMKVYFQSEIKKRIPRTNFYNCLLNAAQQYITVHENKAEVTAGFPWFGRWGRDTFIALPGLCLGLKNTKIFKMVLDTITAEMKGGLFPNTGSGQSASSNSVDAPLWFFWTLQQYILQTGQDAKVWKWYGNKMKAILENYKKGTDYNIRMQENGLIYSGMQGVALTWMDAVVDGKPVTPRTGYAVEINALWYNAIRFTLELAIQNNDMAFHEEWKVLPPMIKKNFSDTFWSEEKKYLADYVLDDFKDYSVRPNQIFATSLPYRILDEAKSECVLEKVKNELLTPAGIRTLAPKNPAYIGIYEGDLRQRDRAYHQGTIWPWLLGHFTEGYLKIHRKAGVQFLKSVFEGFGEDMKNAGIGFVSEIYDGDPPHKAGGAISQAWNTGELIRMKNILDSYEDSKKNN